MTGNIVDIQNRRRTGPSLHLVSEYASAKWAPNADHWIHTARHEAGHAVALVCMHRKFGRDYDSFERILIRPGATDSYVTKRGRRSDCLGCVEHAGSEHLSERVSAPISRPEKHQELRSSDPELKQLIAVSLQTKIVSNLAGPLAEMLSWNASAHLHSKEYNWAWEDNEEEIQSVGKFVDDLRAVTGSGTMGSFERQSYDLVRREWPAIAALADQLMLRHVLEYDEAFAIIAPRLTCFAPIARAALNSSRLGRRF